MKRGKTLKAEMKDRQRAGIKRKKKLDGNTDRMTSTGSTLLDLAITGGRVRGGGLPSEIVVEIFGPSGVGKTVLLTEIAGYIQRKGGQARFNDPEGRLNKLFAKIFDFDLDPEQYRRPNTVTEMFDDLHAWEPPNPDAVNGLFSDSLAALSTKMEMSDKGDKMGQRRAKEFSEGFRKSARMIVKKGYLIVSSNQIRETMNTFGPKYKSPGGEAIGFYSSIRLRAEPAFKDHKIRPTKKINGKEVSRVIGVNILVEVYKNSTWKPYRTAPITIIFDYGIDDIRQNLIFIKQHMGHNSYKIGDKSLGTGLEMAIIKIEKLNLEAKLKEEVIDLWERVEALFDSDRKKKVRV